jgi:hypothetical protein
VRISIIDSAECSCRAILPARLFGARLCVRACARRWRAYSGSVVFRSPLKSGVRARARPFRRACAWRVRSLARARARARRISGRPLVREGAGTRGATGSLCHRRPRRTDVSCERRVTAHGLLRCFPGGRTRARRVRSGSKSVTVKIASDVAVGRRE